MTKEQWIIHEKSNLIPACQRPEQKKEGRHKSDANFHHLACPPPNLKKKVGTNFVCCRMFLQLLWCVRGARKAD